jgi:hypothetical protein
MKTESGGQVRRIAATLGSDVDGQVPPMLHHVDLHDSSHGAIRRVHSVYECTTANLVSVGRLTLLPCSPSPRLAAWIVVGLQVLHQCTPEAAQAREYDSRHHVTCVDRNCGLAGMPKFGWEVLGFN